MWYVVTSLALLKLRAYNNINVSIQAHTAVHYYLMLTYFFGIIHIFVRHRFVTPVWVVIQGLASCKKYKQWFNIRRGRDSVRC